MNTLDVSRWLWDFYFLATLLLSAALLTGGILRQPARRMALAWASVLGTLALVLFSALPNWSRYALLPPVEPVPTSTKELQPVLGQAIQRTPANPTAAAVQVSDTQVTAAQITSIDYGILLSGLVALGSIACLGWLAMGAWQVRRLRASAASAPPEIVALFHALNPGLTHRIQLGVQRELPVAVAVGLRRPCILLPPSLIASGQREQLRSVLAHELAHVEHRDLWLLALLRTLMVLLWPHPLYWFLRRRVRLDQEILADAAAAELTSRAVYAEQLVSLARTAAHLPVPRMASSVGLWEKPSQLTERIKLLLDEQLTILRSCSRRWRVGTLLALLGIAVGLSLVTLTPAELSVATRKGEPKRNDLARATDLRDFGLMNPKLLTPQTTLTTNTPSAIDFDTSNTNTWRVVPDPAAEPDPSTPLAQVVPRASVVLEPILPTLSNQLGRPPELLYLAWLPSHANLNDIKDIKWSEVTLWDVDGKTLDATAATAFWQRISELPAVPLRPDYLTPLMMFFEVDKSINSSLSPGIPIGGGITVRSSTSLSRPRGDINAVIFFMHKSQLVAWPKTISLNVDYATENYRVIKTINAIHIQPFEIEIANGVRWHLDSNKALEHDPQSGWLKAAPGKTAGVLEIRRDGLQGTTTYAARVFLNGQARKLSNAYSTIDTRGGTNFHLEVTEAFDNADQIERVEFLSQRHDEVQIENVPLRLDLLPQENQSQESDPKKTEAYENGVFDGPPHRR